MREIAEKVVGLDHQEGGLMETLIKVLAALTALTVALAWLVVVLGTAREIERGQQ